jgi:hypothetical protein
MKALIKYLCSHSDIPTLEVSSSMAGDPEISQNLALPSVENNAIFKINTALFMRKIFIS